jgi:hypothetical protein
MVRASASNTASTRSTGSRRARGVAQLGVDVVAVSAQHGLDPALLAAEGGGRG